MSWYHTALPNGRESDAEPRDFWAQHGSVAFTHNIVNGLPPEFIDVDIIYADLPWADGYNEFNRRASEVYGVELPALPYELWLYRLNWLLADCRKPWVIVAGKAASRYMGCEWSRPVALNGSTAWAMGARVERPPEDIRNADAMLQWLAGNPRFDIVGDFCAGYGRTCQTFAEAGKQFVATDINPVCIGHIAREAPKWLSATT